MNSLPVLLRREFEEHRGTFLYLPVALAVFLIAIMILALVSGPGSGYVVNEHQVIAPLSGESMHRLAGMSPEEREMQLNRIYTVVSAPVLIVLWIVALVYLLGTLYEERKDRSILFWKSMPISDAATVISKLLSAAIVLPAIYFGCIVLVQTALLLVSSVAALGQSIDIWNTLWVPAHVVDRWLRVGGYLALNTIWYLPAFAWLLLVSSWARSVPAAWALGIPIGLRIMEKVLTPFDWISNWIGLYGWPLGAWHQVLDPGASRQMLNPEMAVSLIIAAAMIYGAIYMRGRTDEI